MLAVEEGVVNACPKVVREGNHVGRLEVVDAAQQIAAGIADAAVGVHKALHDLFGVAHVFTVVHRGHPQAEPFSAVLLDDLLRTQAMAAL